MRQFGIAFLTIAMVVSPVVAGVAESCSCSSGTSSCCDTTVGSSCCVSSGPLAEQASCCASKMKLTTTSSYCQQSLLSRVSNNNEGSTDPCESCSSCQRTTPAEQPLSQGQYDETLQQLVNATSLPSLDVVPVITWCSHDEVQRPSSERPARVLFSVWLN